MNGLTHSKHYITRTQQRSISRIMECLIILYGDSMKCRGGVESISFSRESLQEIENEHGKSVRKLCEKYRNAYLILSGDGVLVTAARSYRRTIH